MDDIDDLFIPVLKWTVFLWVVPYAAWFFAKLLARFAWNWVTEPPRERF